jgi:hypothetical protein
MPRHTDLEDTRVSPRHAHRKTDPSIPSEGYRITITRREVTIEASDDLGALQATRTMAQLHEQYGDLLPPGVIDDWPDLAVRGVMLDVSRDKVPKVDTLCWLIDRLASWKINQVQLYTEHTFAYADHEEVWADASPYTAEEMETLDRFCRRRMVELVPNQNCLGHMERWLAHARYRPLALSPDGFDFMGDHRGPSTLDPANPYALAFVQGLLGELVPNFASHRVNVGLDEPWELPAERVDDYLAWIASLRDTPAIADHEMLMWGDILRDEAAVRGLPDGVTVCEWGYEADHPFAARAELLASAGRPFWLSPGTSSWLSIGGRWTNARSNIVAAATAAVDHGGAGILTTDWGDHGHLQYLPVSEPAFAMAAGAAWCVEANRDLDVAAVVDRFAFADEAGVLGSVLLRLGDVHRDLGAEMANLSLLAAPLYLPRLELGRGPAKGVTVEQYEQVADVLAGCWRDLERAHPRREDGPLVINELGNAIELLTLLCDDAKARLTEGVKDGSVGSISTTTRAALAHRLDPIIDRHQRVWGARNRPGGLDDSTGRLRRLRRIYQTGSTDGVAFYG